MEPEHAESVIGDFRQWLANEQLKLAISLAENRALQARVNQLEAENAQLKAEASRKADDPIGQTIDQEGDPI